MSGVAWVETAGSSGDYGKTPLHRQLLLSSRKQVFWEKGGSNDPGLARVQKILKNVKHLILKCFQLLQSFKNATWAKQNTSVGRIHPVSNLHGTPPFG